MESSLVFKPGPKGFEFQNIVKIKTKSLKFEESKLKHALKGLVKTF
jgi:hypothetical protein